MGFLYEFLRKKRLIFTFVKIQKRKFLKKEII
jgi:hypothetical protein